MVRYCLALALVGFSLVSAALDLCENTMDHLCAAPEALEVKVLFDRSESDFQALRNRARYESSIYGFCPQLAWETGDYFGSCPRQVLKALEQKIYTEARWRIANGEFEAAKTAILNLIDQKLATIKSPQTSTRLRERRDVVAAAPLIFDLVEFSRQLGKLDSLVDDVFSPWNAFSNLEKGHVYVGAMLLLADQYPMYLRWAFAHELGHLIGPLASTAEIIGGELAGFKAWSPINVPFFSVIECVQNTEPKPQRRDDACFQKAFLEFRTLFKEPTALKKLDESSRRMGESPIFSPQWPKLGDEACQSDQTEEAVADWFARTALKDQIQSPEEALELLAPNCASVNLGEDGHNIHPLTKDRLAHLLQEPRLRQVLNCPPSNLPICELKNE